MAAQRRGHRQASRLRCTGTDQGAQDGMEQRTQFSSSTGSPAQCIPSCAHATVGWERGRGEPLRWSCARDPSSAGSVHAGLPCRAAGSQEALRAQAPFRSRCRSPSTGSRPEALARERAHCRTATGRWPHHGSISAARDQNESSMQDADRAEGRSHRRTQGVLCAVRSSEHAADHDCQRLKGHGGSAWAVMCARYARGVVRRPLSHHPVGTLPTPQHDILPCARRRGHAGGGRRFVRRRIR